ncbi:MAG: long-chain fatty acid transport protein [Campylobacterota bacterium]|nr:long-chain fatty acid transport protein [Campylobacterota bacterium]
MKNIKGLVLAITAGTSAMAGGYKIPEQSLNSVALGGAYTAHTAGADTAYYNPANMAFMAVDKEYIEGGLTLAHLPPNIYTLIDPYSGESKTENILIPNFHYVSAPMGDFRWGASLTVPAGLTKRWDAPYQKLYAQEFTLKVLEFNPSVSYKVSDYLSVGGGARIVYSEGVVKSAGDISRDMEGDTFETGYNLAMAYALGEDINLAVTYRSNIDLDEKGTAKLFYGDVLLYNGDASVSVPLPASLNIAVSKTWQEKFTLEFNYEKTYWSKYKTLDFEYAGADIEPLTPYFDDPIVKNWKDTDTFRIGATMRMDNKLTAMMGFSIDETPVCVETVGFELPDSDAKIFSMGFRYQQTENLSWGAAILYDSKESFSVPAGVNPNAVLKNGGSFDEGGAFLTTIGISYEY